MRSDLRRREQNRACWRTVRQNTRHDGRLAESALLRERRDDALDVLDIVGGMQRQGYELTLKGELALIQI